MTPPMSTQKLAEFFNSREHECETSVDYVPKHGRYCIIAYYPRARPTIYRIVTRAELLRYWGNLSDSKVRA